MRSTGGDASTRCCLSERPIQKHYDEAALDYAAGHFLAKRSVEFWQRALDENADDIDALKEEGRRAGALPGWFR